MNKNMILAAILCLLAFGEMTAQVEKKRGTLESYTYIEVQGGAQLTFTNAKMNKLVTPVGAFSFGHYFTPVVGARLHVNGWKAKSGFSDIGKYYKWNYVTADADLMLNITNIFCREKWKAFNVILIGGYGLNNTWGNTELKEILANNKVVVPLMWKENRLGHNIRAGLRLETNMSRPLGVSLEVDANSLNDRFNSKTNDHDDWMVTGMLGISFRFGHKYKSAPAPEGSITNMSGESPKPIPAPESIPEPKPVPIR
jgi:OmpA-OmpF porin, OOP family